MTWKWRQPGFRGEPYTAEHVNTLRSMVRRRYKKPHRFICITDDPVGIEPGIEVIPLWPDHSDLLNPTYGAGPSCYRRLKIFARDAANLIGPRFVSLDLDVIITGDLRPLWDSPYAFVVWGGPLTPREGRSAGYWYNCSMFMMDSGCRPQVWEDFDPRTSPQVATAAGMRGSDQGWLLYKLGWGERTWSSMDGVISWRRHVEPNNNRLATNARIVMFNGREKPWSPEAQRLAWVRENYR